MKILTEPVGSIPRPKYLTDALESFALKQINESELSKFIDEALKDNAFTSADTFTGAAGISWIHRWAITRGVAKDFFKGEPATPEFVMKLAGVTSE